MSGSPKCIYRFGAHRIDWRPGGRAFATWSGGGATEWPWRELVLPWIGSFVLARTRPRPMPHIPRPDRLHLSRPDPREDVAPCDCPIGVDHDGPAALREGQ